MLVGLSTSYAEPVGHDFTELLRLPEHGRVFDGNAHAGLADCAPSGRVRLDALARWIQDVAYGDVEDAGLAAVAVWVVRRMRIRVDRFPRFGERLVLKTFCSGFGRAWAERRTSITPEAGGPASVEAVALWVHLEPDGRRPFPLTPAEMDAYGEAAAGRRVTARLRHPGPPDHDQARPWAFRAADCDLADHVNNAAYWQALEEELVNGPEPERIDAEIEFKVPAQPGPARVLREGDRRWILSGDGDTHASLVLA